MHSFLKNIKMNAFFLSSCQQFQKTNYYSFFISVSIPVKSTDSLYMFLKNEKLIFIL